MVILVCDLKYLLIENIYVLRESFAKVKRDKQEIKTFKKVFAYLTCVTVRYDDFLLRSFNLQKILTGLFSRKETVPSSSNKLWW